VKGNSPIGDVMLLGKTVSSLVKYNTSKVPEMRQLA